MCLFDCLHCAGFQSKLLCQLTDSLLGDNQVAFGVFLSARGCLLEVCFALWCCSEAVVLFSELELLNISASEGLNVKFVWIDQHFAFCFFGLQAATCATNKKEKWLAILRMLQLVSAVLFA